MEEYIKSKVDPITVQILRNRIGSLMDEMHHHFFRSGYSTIVRESRDFSCVILDPLGRLLVAPPMFFHSTAYRYFVGRIFELAGTGGFIDGDVFISNHPYDGSMPHVPDMGVVVPIYHDDKLIGFSGSIAHKADVGGTMPGSTWGQATEIFQEGIVYPPIRLYRAGVLDKSIERLIATNSRQPDLTLGDLRGQVAACFIGRDRLRKICSDCGKIELISSFNAMIEAAGTEFREALSELENGIQEAESYLDSDGIDLNKSIRMHVKICVKEGKIEFDFSESDSQGRGAVNIRRALVEACCFQVLIGMLNPVLRFSDAIRDVVSIKLKEGTVLSPHPPAPCSSYMKTCMTVIDMLIEALGPFIPQRAAAYSGGSGGGLTIDWGPGERQPRGNQYEIYGSAYGGSAVQDGASGVTVHLSNIFVTPVEIIETEFPCRIKKFELIPGSGGDGKYRGGLALRREYEMLQPGMVIFRGDRAVRPPLGVNGGKPGRPSGFVLNPGKPNEREMPITTRIDLEKGDTMRIEAAGGGGYGDPLQRKPETREVDEREGYVTR
ncbi:MAG: hydantoinase B/oxoprolinase family protein [Pseudomonadota bacterium]|nr:hydantoinase B/oxoprolinase family protein [Pseudomonadota bacterium]